MPVCSRFGAVDVVSRGWRVGISWFVRGRGRGRGRVRGEGEGGGEMEEEYGGMRLWWWFRVLGDKGGVRIWWCGVLWCLVLYIRSVEIAEGCVGG